MIGINCLFDQSINRIMILVSPDMKNDNTFECYMVFFAGITLRGKFPNFLFIELDRQQSK